MKLLDAPLRLQVQFAIANMLNRWSVETVILYHNNNNLGKNHLLTAQLENLNFTYGSKAVAAELTRRVQNVA